MTQLRSVTCHMGSHSVTCYPTQVNTPRLNTSHAGWYSIYWRDGRLSWPSWLDSAAAGSRTSDLSITSPTLNHCTTKTTSLKVNAHAQKPGPSFSGPANSASPSAVVETFFGARCLLTIIRPCVVDWCCLAVLQRYNTQVLVSERNFTDVAAATLLALSARPLWKQIYDDVFRHGRFSSALYERY